MVTLDMFSGFFMPGGLTRKNRKLLLSTGLDWASKFPWSYWQVKAPVTLAFVGGEGIWGLERH